ncbi:MarR family winged helix-turn-helix transcriptional regulator [Spongiimicrobium salis]|uniref:MarR family winged helix-turn-helix transcriptional regulator n=1 Tax=Spongiimicrobium salis TaxID=1667022 RepID=UPI00374CC5BF
MKSEDFKGYFDDSIGPWLGRTVKMVDYHLNEVFRAEGLDVSKEQMVVLMKLHQKDGLTQNELAELTFRDKSSMARLLSKMEKKAYISRKQSAGDKRINQVLLTDLGKKVFSKTRPLIHRTISCMQHGISEEERRLMIKVLKKVQQNFKTKTTSL